MKLALLALLMTAFEPLDAERPARSPVTVTWAVYSSVPNTIDAADTAKTRIDTVWIGMHDARLKPVTACKGADGRIVVAGSFTVELVKRVGTSSETKLDIGRYCSFEVQLRRTKGNTSNAPAELKGASIVVEGHRSDGVRFTIRSRLDALITLRATDLEGFAIHDTGARWVVGIDIARWLDGVELSDAATDGQRGKTVVIDEKSYPDLLAKFNANVDHGFALFEDRNADRSLDAEERARPIAVRR